MQKHADILREVAGLRRCGVYAAVAPVMLMLIAEYLRPGWWPPFVPMIIGGILAFVYTRWRWPTHPARGP
jgi:hypothetical protein